MLRASYRLLLGILIGSLSSLVVIGQNNYFGSGF